VGGPVNTIPLLFQGLCDDAAMFPPGNLPAADAVKAHQLHRDAWYSDLVGPFLVAPDRLGEVAAAADRPLAAVLVVRGDHDTLALAVARATAEPALVLAGIELAWAGLGGARGATAALASVLPPGVPGVVEVGPGGVGAGSDHGAPGDGLAGALDVLATGPFRAKYRTGGTTASAFPPEGELAAFLVGCATRGLPFKCTAGLHHAVRHTDARTGFEQHGFLNLLAATHLACQGAEQPAVAELLGVRSGPRLAALLRDLASEHVLRLRRACTAYGTCSIAEPLADLAALNLLGSATHPQEP
jgi:hypothetical protein